MKKLIFVVMLVPILLTVCTKNATNPTAQRISAQDVKIPDDWDGLDNKVPEGWSFTDE